LSSCFLNNNLKPSADELWEYVDATTCFDPDDVICHSVVFNLLIVLSLRQTNLSVAEEFAKLSLAAYEQCNSLYLHVFIHLHMAHIDVYAGRLTDSETALKKHGRVL